MRLARFLSVSVLVSLLFAGSGVLAPASADNIRPNDSARNRDPGNCGPVSSGEAIRIVRARYPGRILDAECHELVPGQPTLRVLILTSDNRRLAVWVDARTGQILRVEGA